MLIPYGCAKLRMTVPPVYFPQERGALSRSDCGTYYREHWIERFEKTGRILPEHLKNNVRFASFSDVFRSYDVTAQLTKATTLDRVGEMLCHGYTEAGKAMGLLNGEDEVYICAALGLTFGVMRTPYNNDLGMDEVVRAVRWHEIAPAYELGYYDAAISDIFLTDDWDFQPGDTWDATANGLIEQHAPAVIARGCKMPEVMAKSREEQPFIAAARFPNGAYALAAFGRTHGRTAYHPVPAAVKATVGALTGKIGIFGVFERLTLVFDRDIDGLPALAADLMDGKLRDVTDRVVKRGTEMEIPGELISEIGGALTTPGDCSEPGMLLQIGAPEDWSAAPQGRERR